MSTEFWLSFKGKALTVVCSKEHTEYNADTGLHLTHLTYHSQRPYAQGQDARLIPGGWIGSRGITSPISDLVPEKLKSVRAVYFLPWHRENLVVLVHLLGSPDHSCIHH